MLPCSPCTLEYSGANKSRTEERSVMLHCRCYSIRNIYSARKIDYDVESEARRVHSVASFMDELIEVKKCVFKFGSERGERGSKFDSFEREFQIRGPCPYPREGCLDEHAYRKTFTFWRSNHFANITIQTCER